VLLAPLHRYKSSAVGVQIARLQLLLPVGLLAAELLVAGVQPG
jgi:hypothetical protein